MISRSPESSYGYLQDFDYGLNWRKLLNKLDLQSEKEDWASFVQEECAKIREQFTDDVTAEFFKPLPKEFVEPPVDGHNAQVHSDVAGSVEAQSDAEDTPDAEGSLGTGDDPNAPNDREVEAISGVKITIGLRLDPQATNNEPPSAEEMKRRWKQHIGTLYFMAVEIIKSEGSVVHEVRHDLESFFWLLVWFALQHPHHNWGSRGCETLFDFDSEEACKEQKIGYLNREHGVLVHCHEPLNSLLEGFHEICRKIR
ncbi:hypothetical protein DAEQUDRAFT_815855 [Daedalea quercina L-15889]|uniref:Fungal-type protein kinase domain-containing protein n=1 Tax=Daedalea quercina L-15889 TaxID=1314783 RepID=A0A165KEM5_9APHY|nr:hypothetical protein DAEQUDRAFT_815855 [Daedalea quercina L-15889]